MRRATWILWLMLALLPLRSWAVASMGLPQAAQDGAHRVAMAEETAATVSAMPCHQDAGESGSDSACQACDWCHAAMGTAPDAPDLGKPPMADTPHATPQRDTGRPAVGGLERPPRSLLA